MLLQLCVIFSIGSVQKWTQPPPIRLDGCQFTYKIYCLDDTSNAKLWSEAMFVADKISCNLNGHINGFGLNRCKPPLRTNTLFRSIIAINRVFLLEWWIILHLCDHRFQPFGKVLWMINLECIQFFIYYRRRWVKTIFSNQSHMHTKQSGLCSFNNTLRWEESFTKLNLISLHGFDFVWVFQVQGKLCDFDYIAFHLKFCWWASSSKLFIVVHRMFINVI